MGGNLKRTPLFHEHESHQAKLVDFNQWEMPVQYPTGILREHEIVRTAVGLFDVSHMGRFEVTGPGAVPFVHDLITNDLEKAEPGQLLYAAMCREDGGVLDDVTVYRMADRVMVVANAGNLIRIWDWLETRAMAWVGAPVELRNRSTELAQLAFQGPRAEEVICPLVAGDLSAVGYYRFLVATVAGIRDVVVSRNGYTGEDGFEIYVPAGRSRDLWRALLHGGEAVGAAPIGLGARDTLRLEMCYCLYGNELNLDVSPLEGGIGWTVKMKKTDFIGKDALAAQKAAGLTRSIVGFAVEGQRMPRHGQVLFAGGREVGVVTSGGFCPSLKQGMGLGFVPPGLSAVGTELEVDIRGAKVPARVVERPFYKHASHK
jgi:aminomethyltransferase